jgi:hypothetical protein
MGAGVLQSHTATEQWQSFEIRMRRRRVERCVLRAAVAIDTGALDDARAALEEVERLDPREPAIEPLRTKLAAAELRAAAPVEVPAVETSLPESPVLDPPVFITPAPEEAVPEAPELELGFLAIPEPPRRVFPASAAAVLIAISGSAGWFLFSQIPPGEPDVVRADTAVVYDSKVAGQGTTPPERAVAEPAVRISETAVTAAATSELIAAPGTPVVTAGAGETALSGPPDKSTVETARPGPAAPAVESSSSNSSNTASVANTAAGTATPAPAVERRPVPASLEPSPVLPDPAPAPPAAPAPGAVPAGSGTDAVALSATSVTLAPPPEPPAAPSTTATPSTTAAPSTTAPTGPSPAASQQAGENRVRAVLVRYEAAYNALDAAAASAVWPGVDRRALTSAFQALSAQRVSLGRCDVRVTGEAAQADCKGTARWQPKIGGGPQTAPRQWRFDLRDAGGDWIITRATVR